MSITRIRYFDKVAKLGSVREAADVLHVAPSAISRQLVKLEEQMEADLFEPDGRGIRLTQAGRILASHASRMLDSLDHAKSQIDDLQGLRRGHVHVWTAEGHVSDLVLPAIAEFRHRYPAVTHELSIASSDRIIRALLDDNADIGVVFNPPEHADLRIIAKVSAALLAIGHPQHPALQTAHLSLRELAEHPLALPEGSFGLRHMIDAAAKASRVTLAPVLVTDSIEAMRAFARTGAGLTVLPRLAVAGDLRRRTLRAMPLGDSSLRKGTTAVLVRQARLLPIAAVEFAKQLSDMANRIDP
jgi:DNA-binding transcriptional LysR family regulator